jgi:CHAT domain-containing protein/tetratricopeptide (TPR) repeat protein
MAFWRRHKGSDPGRKFAREQFGLGLRYQRLLTGDRTANLQRSIECFTEALRFFTVETTPLNYAAAQNNLGISYSMLPTGDRGANLQRSIECFTEALRFLTAETAPSEYAQTQNNLGNAYRQLPIGDRSVNLARAIAHYGEALRFRTAETAPSEYAQTQNNLGNAYRELPTGDPSANLGRAIECFTEALRFRTAETAPFEYAQTQNNLGNAYAELPAGNRSTHLARAIECFTEALRFRTAEDAPYQYAATQYNLGNAYANFPTGDRSATLGRAIECFTEALRFRTAEDSPLEYAATQTSLGNVYADLPTGDRSANLARAVECFTEALRFRTAEASPLDYAATQASLGNVYTELPTGDRAANLAKAIACYTEALRFYTAQEAPFEYAMTQNNLGAAYRVLPTGDRAANLAKAIACYTEALRFYTVQAAPLDYAMTQHNLGTVYTELPTGNRSANLEQAIVCYTEALKFRTALAAPLDYAMTQQNLGNAYAELPTRDRSANLARAVECFTEALRFRTAEAAPSDYAQTQSNLGTIYAELLTGDRAANLEQAIECFTEALRFYTAEAAPLDYAMTQNNLGAAYAELPAGDRAANLTKAIACYTEALRFRTADAAPAECRFTARRLGDIYLEQGGWALAHTAYSSAIAAGEFLYQATGSEAGRQAELAAAGDTVAGDAYCLARLGRLDEAVRRLEAGRARALDEALARDRAALEDASDTDRAAFMAAADRIKVLEAEGRRVPGTDAPTPPGGRSFAERSAELVRAREDLAGVVERIRAYLPGFMGEGLDYPDVAAAGSPDRPLIYLLTTSEGSLALLVRAGPRIPAPEDVVWLDGFTAATLDALLVQRNESGEARGGYLVAQVSRDLGELAAAVTENMEILRRELIGPLARRLADIGLAAATVIPVGLLSLLPLPAAAPEGYTIALAPSARALGAACRALQERAEEAPVLLAVGNPLPLPAGWDPLEYAGVEVRAIERFFAPGSRRVLPEETATREDVMQGLPRATHLHLACHGGFDPDEPLDSALYLSGGDRLTLRDLLDGDLDISHHRLAVLSACQTGITEFERVPDEVIGLPAGFLQAGVPGVVATLWPVNDQSTAVLVAEFYRLLLAEQKDPATALASARGHLRDATARELAEWFERSYDDSAGTDLTAYKAAADLRSLPDPADHPYAHPVYWAGFVYTGP